MKRTFRCHICGLKMVIEGTPRSIAAMAERLDKNHRHNDRTDTSMSSDEGYQMASLTAPGLFPPESKTAEEIQTCPRRMQEMGPWKYEPNLDTWRRVGPDRVCSFCGSMHPDDFEKVIDRCLQDEGVRLNQADNPNKVYIVRPEIPNAGEGAIKYYKQHNPAAPEWLERVGPKYLAAMRQSSGRLWRWMDEIKIKQKAVDQPTNPKSE